MVVELRALGHTDADAMDFDQTVVDDAAARNIKINFILTRTCSSGGTIPHSNVDPNYGPTVDATGGVIYHVSKSNVGTEIPLIVESAAELGPGGGSGDDFTAGSNDIELVGSNAITTFEITVSSDECSI